VSFATFFGSKGVKNGVGGWVAAFVAYGKPVQGEGFFGNETESFVEEISDIGFLLGFSDEWDEETDVS
jgi:hypothetical protein